MIGDLVQADKHWQLRFERELAHSPARVWRALTEPEELRKWFPDEIVVEEWKVGARLRFQDANAKMPPFEGEVLAFQPPSLLEFRWGTDTIRLEVAPRGSGCVLTLIDTIDELGKAARDGAGWHVCLDALQRALDGKAAPGVQSDAWNEVHEDYVRKFGPEASSIGPPEGWSESAS
ncbi:MAG TPA: SRPBCC family protein [Candidatus Dormibacteraeota bacterium]|nr:SRPBCC family protein [Candidatus Dormibacteraeota bacterium]